VLATTHIGELAKELGVTRRCLYKWRTKLDYLERMCELARVSRASFYRSLKERGPAEEEMEVRSAVLLGWMVFDSARSHVDNFQLVTKTARYGTSNPEEFSVALYSLSSAALKAYQSDPR
jgi:hypothetical protein